MGAAASAERPARLPWPWQLGGRPCQGPPQQARSSPPLSLCISLRPPLLSRARGLKWQWAAKPTQVEAPLQSPFLRACCRVGLAVEQWEGVGGGGFTDRGLLKAAPLWLGYEAKRGAQRSWPICPPWRSLASPASCLPPRALRWGVEPMVHMRPSMHPWARGACTVQCEWTSCNQRFGWRVSLFVSHPLVCRRQMEWRLCHAKGPHRSSGWRPRPPVQRKRRRRVWQSASGHCRGAMRVHNQGRPHGGGGCGGGLGSRILELPVWFKRSVVP